MDEDVPPEVFRMMQLAESGDVNGFIGHLDSVPMLSVHARNNEGETALHLASLYGHLAIVHLCLDRGAEVNALDEDSSSPLHNACASGHLDIARVLLSAGADLLSADSDGDTSLHHACNGNHADVARLLAKHGASVAVKNRSGRTPLALADDSNVRAACLEGAAEFRANPPADARRIIRAKRPVKPDGGAEAPVSDMPPPPPRRPSGPTLNDIGRRPSRDDMSPIGGAEPLGPCVGGGLGLELPPEILQAALADPQLASSLSNPRLLGAMRRVLADPSSLSAACEESPELSAFLSRVVSLSQGEAEDTMRQ